MNNADEVRSQVAAAAKAIHDADTILVGAGAGFGVDSGLPDFRGDEGFWNAYPPFRKAGLSFYDMANPVWFKRRPELGWGFYGHRRNLYRATTPHPGFTLLRKWAAAKESKGFVFTSNVDGHFQRAGFAADQVFECHGSINHLQCAIPCCDDVWSAGEDKIEVDESTFRAAPPLPLCEVCGELARPNVLMFGDFDWVSNRTDRQSARYRQWQASVAGQRLVVVECGAGKAVPTVRYECERSGGQLIRINPRESDGPSGTISITAPALQALEEIESILTTL